MAKPKKTTAVQKVERSQLSQKSVQRELMGNDVDLEKLLVYLKSKIKFDSIDRVKDINIRRTIEGASTVTVTLIDPDRAVLRSGLLNSKLDIELDGLWFRLVKVEKEDDELDLIFEDREIAILRGHNKLKIAHRSQTTRAEFVRNLIRETDKEISPPIAVVIPELHKIQPIEKSTDLPFAGSEVVDKTGGIPETVVSAQEAHRHGETTPGIAARPTLTVKGQPIDREQVKNSNIILKVGQSMGVRRKLLVCSIMTAIQESTLRNLPYGDRDSLGLFQQRASWGSARDRLDPATAARMFFNRAVDNDADDPTRPYWDLCQAVQHSAFPLAYNQWQDEAERIVNAYGVVGGDNEGDAAEANLMGSLQTDGSNYIFYRGEPQLGGKRWKKEDSWKCTQRLATEVNIRAFFVSGVFYWIFEDDLFKQKPVATITEFSQGVNKINFDLDSGKASATVTIECEVGAWLVPPGAVFVLQNMGPVNGRWLVNTFERSMFDTTATITCKKPQPRLPEPLQNDINQIPTWGSNDPAPSVAITMGPAFGGILDPSLRGTRQGIAEICRQALASQARKPYHYLQKRPYPDTLWSDEAHAGIDCSSFVILVYKEASCPDPSGSGFNGYGFTGTLVANGTPVLVPQVGDLVFYRGDGNAAAPGHVGIYVGNNEVVEIGSNNGILKLPMNYRSDIIEYRSYLPLAG